MGRKTPSRLAWRLGLASALVALGALTAAVPAEAAGAARVVTVSDDFVKAQCRFTVLSVDSANGTIRARLTAQAGTVSFKTAYKVAWVSAHCRVISAEPPNIIDSVSLVAEANRRHAYESGIITIPKTSVSPAVCLEHAEYRLRDGNIGLLDLECA
jgi:hypothetical protein